SSIPATIEISDSDRRSRRDARHDAWFRRLLKVCALLVLAALLGAALSTLWGGREMLFGQGLHFLTSTAWNPVADDYGALAPIFGTLVTSLIALVLAVPFMARIEPGLSATLGRIPLLGKLFQGPPIGLGLLTAGIVLAVMILPFICSVMREVFQTVPNRLKESSYALGSTTWEVVWDIVLPYTRSAVIGGIFLGLGRALGETMAVTFVLGNAYNITASLLMPGTSISSSIANEFNEAVGTHRSALIALGFLLFVVTFVVLLISRLMLRQLARREGA